MTSRGAEVETVTHSPVPWRMGAIGRTNIFEDNDLMFPRHIAACESGLNTLSDEQCQANAAFIVQAVNSHAVLCEALELAQQAVEASYLDFDDKVRAGDESAILNRDHLFRVSEQCRAALAAASGGK